MYGWNDLKKAIAVTASTVECPVLGCGETVERQRKTFLKEARFTVSVQQRGIPLSVS